MDYPIQLANQLRSHVQSLRRHRGLTQAQLGNLLGLGQARIAEIESNPGLISVDQLIRLMAALGTSIVLRVDEEPAGTAPRRTARLPDKKGEW